MPNMKQKLEWAYTSPPVDGVHGEIAKLESGEYRIEPLSEDLFDASFTPYERDGNPGTPIILAKNVLRKNARAACEADYAKRREE
jgi:hypothetical protein